MNNDDYTADYWIGTQAILEGRLSAAIAAFENVPETSPCWVMAQGNIGLALFKQGRHQDAELRLRRTLEQIQKRGCPYPPAHIQFMRNLGETIGEQGRLAEAIEHFRVTCDLTDTLSKRHSTMLSPIACEKAHTLNSCGAACIRYGDFHRAVAMLEEARTLYRKHSGADKVGHAEVLTNLVLALGAIGEDTRAGFALEEAISIVRDTEDYDQLVRALMAAGKIRSNIISPEKVLEVVEAGAADALEGGRAGVAYGRYCIGVSAALELTNGEESAQRMIECARKIEAQLDPLHPVIPKLRYLEAAVAHSCGQPLAKMVKLLFEGAHSWFKLIAVDLVPADFRAMTCDLHLHFRQLADLLLADDRTEEAFISFEIGRALGYAVDVDPRVFSQIVTKNPFAADGSRVDLELLRTVQRTLDVDDLIIVLAVFPPRMIAFVLSRDNIEVMSHVVASNMTELETLDTEIKALPLALGKAIGMGAFPKTVVNFGQELAHLVGRRKVSHLIPYNSLHSIPWRALLHQCGLDWQQLAFATGFSVLMKANETGPETLAGHKVIALGHGAAGGIDLQDEASDFAALFGAAGTTIKGCIATQVSRALQEKAIVLISCHGIAIDRGLEVQLALALGDGQALAENLFPSKVLCPLVILSACDSGVYNMAWSDYPLGAAPMLLSRGAGAVIGTRFPIQASFAAKFFPQLARLLLAGSTVEAAFCRAMEAMETMGADTWRDLACIELLKPLQMSSDSM